MKTSNHIKIPYTTVLVLYVILFLTTCAHGIRLKNIINYPVPIQYLSELDTLVVQPDRVIFTGQTINKFRVFNKSIHIVANPEKRALWTGDDSGCFVVNDGANVYFSDINFKSGTQDSVLIIVKDGSLTLDNCSIFWAHKLGIKVEEKGELVLKNVVISYNGTGGIRSDGGIVRLVSARFENVGGISVDIRNSALFEAHKTEFIGSLGDAIQLEDIEEVWLDTVKVEQAFRNGCFIQSCDFVLLNHMELNDNGKHGLVLKDTHFAGMISITAKRNKQHGLDIQKADTLKIVNSEFGMNDGAGASITQVENSIFAGCLFANNAENGMQVEDTDSLSVHHSVLQNNQEKGIFLKNVSKIDVSDVQIRTNNEGLSCDSFNRLTLQKNHIAANLSTGATISGGDTLIIGNSIFRANGLNGLDVQRVTNISLTDNEFIRNGTGTVILASRQITSDSNIWKENVIGASFSEVDSLISRRDQWKQNQENGLVLANSNHQRITEGKFLENQLAVYARKAALLFDRCFFDQNIGGDIQLQSGRLRVDGSVFSNGGKAIDLGNGSKAVINQCRFTRNYQVLQAGASSELSLSYSELSGQEKGIKLGKYATASIYSNVMSHINDYILRIDDSHIGGVTVEYNVISKCGGILFSSAHSGFVSFMNNTLRDNKAFLTAEQNTIRSFNHNICIVNDQFDMDVSGVDTNWKYNCWWKLPKTAETAIKAMETNNLFVDPQVTADDYLDTSSPCLKGGENGQLIGARGVKDKTKPTLIP